jgi:hypothetical protein
MHLHFIYPRWTKLLEDYPALKGALSGYDIGNFRMAGLGIPVAAAALPPGHTVTFTDENVEAVDLTLKPDLVGIGCFTPQAAGAYRLADAFRSRGVPVLGGGIHPTMASEDSLRHFTAVVRGPVEGLWGRILDDLAHGRLGGSYQGDPRAAFVQPRRELFAASAYLRAGVVQTARGCPVGCSFCVVPDCYGREVIRKPVTEVVDDIASLEQPCFFFADENLLFPDDANRAYTRELMHALVERGVRKASFVASYPFLVRQLGDDDIALLHRAGCRQIYLVLGLQQPLAVELADAALVERMLALRNAGIEAMATFTLGHDDDPVDIEPPIMDFCARSATNLAEFTLHTPFPGTAQFAALERTGRILTRDWARYNAAHVVFQPRGQSAADLHETFLRLWHRFYDQVSEFGVNVRYVKGFGREIIDRGQKTGG